jgi:hypothetical protein
MHTNAGSRGSRYTRGQDLLAERYRTCRLFERLLRRSDWHLSFYRLRVRCSAGDAQAVEALVREALGEHVIGQRRHRPSEGSGAQWRSLEMIVRCPRVSQRVVMAAMGRLEREALIRGVFWESMANPASEFDWQCF